MAVRWRADGTLVCAAMRPEEPGDTYIDDRLHYELSVVQRVLVADLDHERNALWHWLHGNQLLRGAPDVPDRATGESPTQEDQMQHNERGQAAVNLLWAIAVVVILGAILKLFGVDVTDWPGAAMNWCADKIGDGWAWVLKKAQGRN